MFGVKPPFYDGPVETMAFNLYAMTESRKDELRELAKRMTEGSMDTTGSMYLNQSDVEFLVEECQRIRELDYKRNYVGGMHNGYYGL